MVPFKGLNIVRHLKRGQNLDNYPYSKRAQRALMGALGLMTPFRRFLTLNPKPAHPKG